MKLLDLCSGVGGFSLAARWMGWQTIQFVEIDSFCQKVLAKNFPGVPIHDDLTTFNATGFLNAVDIVTAGYPCQPFSQAGYRGGAEDERHLWPQVFRIIQESKPTWIVCENVIGHVSLGLDDVLSDLEIEGYAAQPMVIPACGKNAIHKRDRVWIIGHANSNGFYSTAIHNGTNPKSNFWLHGKPIGHFSSQAFWDSTECADNGSSNGLPHRIHQPRKRGNDKRNQPQNLEEHRLHALGNSIHPEIAFEIFKAIEAAERNL